MRRHLLLDDHFMKKAARTKTQPTVIKPMLATLVKQPFPDSNYVFEVKWDGYRILAHCDKDKTVLRSRGGEDYTRKYPTVAQALLRLKRDCILDGEVIYLNSAGKPDFDSLQRVNGQKAPLVYYVFDLLWLDGEAMISKPLLERKEVLKALIPEDPVLKYSDHFMDGAHLFKEVSALGLEGIVAKQKDSRYVPGERSKKWLKITTENRQEFVIGGWVESEKRNTFRTLLFGNYENGKLKWRGHAGGGFKERDMPVILKRLKELEIQKNPFDTDVEYSEGKPHWVKPELVANIKFATTTRSGKIRKPAIFLGFREDKKSFDITPEVAQNIPEPNQGRGLKNFPTADASSSRSNWPELEREPVRNKQELDVGGCTITIHNVDKQIWKGIKKVDLVQYYNSVSKYILPHLRD